MNKAKERISPMAKDQPKLGKRCNNCNDRINIEYALKNEVYLDCEHVVCVQCIGGKNPKNVTEMDSVRCPVCREVTQHNKITRQRTIRVAEAVQNRVKVECRKHAGKMLRFVDSVDGELGCARCILEAPMKNHLDQVVEFKQELA